MNTQNLFTVAAVQLTYKNHTDLMERPTIETEKDITKIILQLDEMKQNIDYEQVCFRILVSS